MAHAKTFALGLAVLTLMTTAEPALAAADFTGKWTDNASAMKRIGNLTIGRKQITLGRTAWSVAATGDFGDGEYFRIAGVNRHSDPMGCGPHDKVTYILVVPVAQDPGSPRRAVMVTFYSGEDAPVAATLASSMDVCRTHPFGRAG